MKPIMRYNLLVFNCALLVVPTNFTKIEKKTVRVQNYLQINV